MRVFLTVLASLSAVLSGCSGTSHVVESDAGLVPDAVMPADAITLTPDAWASVDVGMRPDTSRPLDAWVEPDAGPVPSFDDIYTSILVPRCGRCHVDGPGAESRRPRMPDVDTAYDQLFDRPVETPWVETCGDSETTYYRVRAFDPDTSLLAFLPDCYIRDADHDELTDEERTTIRAWIAGGAPRESF